MAFAALANTVAFVLYLFTSKSTQLPSGERAWSFLARAHGAACLSLLLGLVAGSAIFHDLFNGCAGAQPHYPVPRGRAPPDVGLRL